MAKAFSEGAREVAEVKLLPVGEAKSEDVKMADAVALGCPSMGGEKTGSAKPIEF